MAKELVLADVTTRALVLPAGTCCDAIDLVFQADPQCTSLVVAVDGTTDRDGVLLVNRHDFFQAMTGPLGYGGTPFHDRPIVEVVNRPGLVVTGDTLLEDAALAAIDSDLGGRDDLLVRLHDGWGTASARLLLRHLSGLHASRVAQLEQSEVRFRRLVENAGEVVLVLDRVARVLYRSRHVPGLPAFVVGDRAFGTVVPDDVRDVAAVFGRALEQPGRDLQGEFRVHDTQEGMHVFEYTARNLLDDPSIEGVVVNLRDITERRRLEDELRHDALHDRLTGLGNRQLLYDRAALALDRLERFPGWVAVLYCDLDGFKQVNDSLGHAFGDHLLAEAARRLNQATRRGDTLARFGGDEFVVLAEDCPPHEATMLADRLVSNFEQPLVVDGRAVDITVTVGFSCTEGGADAGTLVKQADTAMYAAKKAGRNRIFQFTPADLDRELRTSRLVGDLSPALPRGELSLVYQPIFDIRKGGLAGAEGLLRWTHPHHGPVSPSELIPLAEQNGMIQRIGRWVIEEACRTFAAWQASGVGPAWVSVNLSASQLDDDRIVADVAEALSASGLESAHLHLELTETAIVVDLPRRRAVLRDLRDFGVSIALDDFGTGYSSLSSISSLAIDVVKIDRTFVVNLLESPEAAVMLRGIIDLSHSLGYEVVAEGIEHPSELRLVESMGCDYVQGYLLGRPDAPDALARMNPPGHVRRDDAPLPEVATTD